MGFELVKLGDYLKLQKGISYTSANLVSESETGLLTINAFHPGGGYKPDSEKPFDGIVHEDYLLHDGDVLVAMTEQDAGLLASPLNVKIGNTSYSELTFSLDVGRFFIVREGLDPRFVMNVLRIPAFRRRAAYGDTGSTVQRLPYEALYELKVPKPSLQEQQVIIDLIDHVDDKIRLNGDVAKNIEQIAQTIFKSWFVDFDPVHAKTRGEKPVGMDDETAALFPDSFEDSELGLIPSGWEVSSVGQEFRITMGQSPPGTDLNSDKVGTPFYQGKTDFGTRFPAERIYAVSGKRTAEPGSTLISVRAPVGALNQALTKSILGRGVAAAMHKSGYQGFTFEAMRSLKNEFDFFNGEGSVFGAINKNDFESIPFLSIPSKVVEKFSDMCEPVNTQIKVLHEQNQTLTEIRDALLPRLISGELEIPEELL